MRLVILKRIHYVFAAAVLLGVAVLAPVTCARAGTPEPYPGTRTIRTPYSFTVLLQRLNRAVKDQKMVVIAEASASQGAAARGVKIPGNAVVMVFRNDFAVRMLRASVAAGIEAPLRVYVTATRSGKANITYRAPTAVFAPYRNAQLNRLARKLDVIFKNIVDEAAGKT